MKNFSVVTLPASVKRLLVYFFWDAEGIVDDYVIHSLKALGEYCSSIVVVVNGDVNSDGYRKLRTVSHHLIKRENVGLDAWAYKTAFEYVGYDNLSEFDEVLVTNFTLYGPLFSLAETFSRLDATPCDFWGLAGFNEKTTGRSDVQHLQSYFVVYRRSLTSSRDFRNYWQQLPEIASYTDSVNLHELAQTPYFAARGYNFSSFLSTKKYASISPYNFVINCADRVLVEDRCPFIKRRALYFANGYFERGSSIDKIDHIANFIKSQTDYDITMILDNVERTQKPVVVPAPEPSPPPEPITRYRHYKRRLGSYVHPRKSTRDILRRLLADADRPQQVAAPEVATVEYREPLWDRYLNCFRINKPDATQIQTWVPRIQHIGKYSYAAPDTHIQCVSTVIGSFCSIGQRVVIGHGKHPKDFLSSSPFFYFDELGFKSEDMPAHDEFWYIEPIIIGNDVWIGDGAWIRNGVTIGDGAIIGARAVVTKDVPPYAIVAGVPGGIIGYRFDEMTIRALLDSEWWNLPDDVIRQIPFDDVPQALSFLAVYSEKTQPLDCRDDSTVVTIDGQRNEYKLKV
jgi:lipopolysaccharide biosynthesis protein